MKTIKLYSVYDKIANRFNPVFIAPNDEVALKMFKTSIEKNNQNIAEFELYPMSEAINEPSCMEDYSDDINALSKPISVLSNLVIGTVIGEEVKDKAQ